MENEDITCDFCKEIKCAFIDVTTTKNSFLSNRFMCCIDCFKNKDVNDLIKQKIRQDVEMLEKHHLDKIKEIKKQAGIEDGN